MSESISSANPIAIQPASIRIQVATRQFLSDLHTPVTLYLQLRDHFTEPVLLESNEISNRENSHSYLGLDAIGHFIVQNGTLRMQIPNTKEITETLVDKAIVPDLIQQYLDAFSFESTGPNADFNGLFGHVGFDGVQYFESLHFEQAKRKVDLPDIRFTLYRFIIEVDHYRDRITVLENIPEGNESDYPRLERLLQNRKLTTHFFRTEGQEESNLTDEEFMELVQVGKDHCQKGDVFQIVFSRQFSQKFSGDEFQVYRVLRSINPSPYLFFFDYGDYKIMGSSPEAQMQVRQGVASINPIAGTYKRTGDLEEDAVKAEELSKDPKENAEHVMLVDLARNDLSRHAENVRVKEFKNIQYYSHVIHLVSTVEGDLGSDTTPIRVFADTFPAGTLSGAPKYRALELIDQYENQNRAFYGGSIGFLDFNGNINQAIVIRSFLSMNQTLFSQAGAGIVVDSVPEKELQEVNHKLGALKKALEEAERLK